MNQTTISPGGESRLETENGQIIIDFLDGAITADTTVTITADPPDEDRPAPTGYKATGFFFSVQGADNLTQEITITVKYADDDLEMAEHDPNNLVLARYDEESQTWQPLATYVDTSTRTLSVSTPHLSRWAVLARTSGTTIAMWVWIVAGVAGATGAVILAATIGMLAHRRSTAGSQP